MSELVAIHRLTEAQATAWVEGPLSEEMREKCELQMLWSEDLAAWVACIWASRGRIGVGVVGDSDPACRVYAIRKAVAEAASSSGMVTEAVYVPDVSGAPDPEALLQEAIKSLNTGGCPRGRLTHHCIAPRCPECWRDYLARRVQEKAKCAEEAEPSAREAD